MLSRIIYVWYSYIYIGLLLLLLKWTIARGRLTRLEIAGREWMHGTRRLYDVVNLLCTMAYALHAILHRRARALNVETVDYAVASAIEKAGDV
jgi:hypothetical protein